MSIWRSWVPGPVSTHGWRSSDLKIFFELVGKERAAVGTDDVFAFLTAQRAPRQGNNVARLEDGEAGWAAQTIARRLSSVRGLYSYLLGRDDKRVSCNPVPSSLAARRPGARRGKGRSAADPDTSHPATGAVAGSRGRAAEGAAQLP